MPQGDVILGFSSPRLFPADVAFCFVLETCALATTVTIVGRGEREPARTAQFLGKVMRRAPTRFASAPVGTSPVAYRYALGRGRQMREGSSSLRLRFKLVMTPVGH